MRTRISLPAVTALVLAIVFGAVPASATAAPELSASPATLSIGDTTTLTADRLGDLSTASFGLAETDAGAFVGEGVQAGGTTAVVPVSDGTASIDFTPTRSGEVVIAVGTGESVLTQATVTVTAATATPTTASSQSGAAAAAATPTDEATPEAEPDPEAEAGRFAFVLIPLIAAAIVVVGGIFVITRGRRRRRGD